MENGKKTENFAKFLQKKKNRRNRILKNYLDVSRTARTCFNQPDASSEFRKPPIVSDFWSMEIAEKKSRKIFSASFSKNVKKTQPKCTHFQQASVS